MVTRGLWRPYLTGDHRASTRAKSGSGTGAILPQFYKKFVEYFVETAASYEAMPLLFNGLSVVAGGEGGILSKSQKAQVFQVFQNLLPAHW
jgi:hypothetical protein